MIVVAAQLDFADQSADDDQAPLAVHSMHDVDRLVYIYPRGYSTFVCRNERNCNVTITEMATRARVLRRSSCASSVSMPSLVGSERNQFIMNNEKSFRRVASATVLALVLVTTSCGGDDNVMQPAVAETVADAPGETTTQPAAESILVDVRDVEEFASGHLPEAVNIPFNDGTLAAQIADLDPNAAYRVYCRSGNRSGQAVALMVDAGFTNVVDLGGLEAAVASTGLELVTD